MRRVLMLLLVFIMVLTGCNVHIQENKQSEIEAINPITQEKQDNSVSSEIWDNFIKQNGKTFENLLGVPQAPELYPLYLEGLKHENPLVRWYSANKSIEYAFDVDKDKLIEELRRLQSDPDEKVRAAAVFALSAVTQSFDGDKFVKTQDGKRTAFYRYHEAAYNDGDIWISTETSNGAWYQYHADGSVTKMTWSPDGNKLCIEYGGRSWHFVSLIDIPFYQLKDIGLFSHIMKNQKEFSYKLIMNPRVDPQITLLEWSPNSDKMLLFYSFADDDYKFQSGTAIYNVSEENFESIKPFPEESDEGVVPRKPAGFKWDR